MKQDVELQSDVMEELRWEPAVNAAHIGVAAQGGIVTLAGHVPSYAEKWAAERAAERVFGVSAVVNELDVRLPGNGVRSDEDVALACLASLRANLSVPDENVKVVVRGGWVTLDGDLQWRFQREAAESAIRPLSGVRGITNSIVVASPVAPGDVKSRIEAAFRRSAEIDARRIRVELRDGKVILRGSVRSAAERDEAQHAAWAATGVTAVENELTISP